MVPVALLCLLPAVPVAADEETSDATTERDEPAAEEDPSASGTEIDGQEASGAAWDAEPPADLPEFETVVTGRRSAARDETQDVVEIDGATLRDSARPSTLEAIAQQSADVYVPGRGALHGVASGATGGIYVRGLGGSPNTQVLVVEDGVPDTQGIFGHPIPDAYVPFLLEDALVLPGGDSVLYGTNAMGGVVVLRSRWREEEGWELRNDAAYGSYATVREAASILARLADWDLAGAFLALVTDGHRDGAGGSEMVGQLAVRYRFTRDLGLTLRNKAVHLEGADPGPVTHPNPDHIFDVWRDNASLRLEWNGGALRLAATPFLNVGVHRLYDGFESLDYVAGGTVELQLALLRDAELLVGAGAEHTNGDVQNRITGERSLVHGLTDVFAFAQLTLRPVEDLALVLGTRETFSDTYGFLTLYKAGARWDVYEGLYTHTRVTRNYRHPTIRELYLPFPTANPDLRPEFSFNWDATVGYESDLLDVSCTVYRTEADDMIRYFGAWPTAEVVNIDHIAIWGVEGRVELHDLGPISVSASAAWQDVGRYTRQNPEAKLDFALDVGEDFGPHFLGGSVTGEWVHGLYMSNYGLDPIPDVLVLDLSVRYRYRPPDRDFALEPYLHLRNLLDRDVAYVAGYPMPGLNALLGLRVEV